MLSNLKGKLGAGGVDNAQMDQLIQDNQDIRNQLANLLKNYSQGPRPIGVPAQNNTGAYFDPHSAYQPPSVQNKDGVFASANSRQFDQQQYQLTDPKGGVGVQAANAHENAFLQALLMDAYDLIRRKDQDLKAQKDELELLHTRMRSQCLTQDQLYMDFVKMERHFQKQAERDRTEHRNTQQLLMEEQTKNQKLETLMKSMNAGPESKESKLIELTKQNSILDVNLLKLARKYQCLEEQEKLLRREYHSKDEDQALKEKEFTLRICRLREWKQKAITQMRFMQEKLRVAIPITEYNLLKKEVELAKQQTRQT